MRTPSDGFNSGDVLREAVRRRLHSRAELSAHQELELGSGDPETHLCQPLKDEELIVVSSASELILRRVPLEPTDLLTMRRDSTDLMSGDSHITMYDEAVV